MIRERQAVDLEALQLALREVHDAQGYPSVWPADPAAFLQPSGTVAGWVAVVHEQVVGQVLLCSLGQWPGQHSLRHTPWRLSGCSLRRLDEAWVWDAH